MELILWRHAEAEDSAPDLKRKLTMHGEKQADRMANWLKKRLPNHTHILVSPAVRTQQTAHALNLDFTTLDIISPGAAPETILEVAQWPGIFDEGEAEGAVMVVGHQPTLGMAAALTLTGKAYPWSMKKGAILWISSRMREGQPQASLKLVISPDQL